MKFYNFCHSQVALVIVLPQKADELAWLVQIKLSIYPHIDGIQGSKNEFPQCFT